MPDKIIVLHQYNRVWRERVDEMGDSSRKTWDQKGGRDLHVVRVFGRPLGRGLRAGDPDTTGSDDSEWLDPRGYPHSAQGVFEERYTRVDRNHLEMKVTVNDPAILYQAFCAGGTQQVRFGFPISNRKSRFACRRKALLT